MHTYRHIDLHTSFEQAFRDPCAIARKADANAGGLDATRLLPGSESTCDGFLSISTVDQTKDTRSFQTPQNAIQEQPKAPRPPNRRTLICEVPYYKCDNKYSIMGPKTLF